MPSRLKRFAKGAHRLSTEVDLTLNLPIMKLPSGKRPNPGKNQYVVNHNNKEFKVSICFVYIRNRFLSWPFPQMTGFAVFEKWSPGFSVSQKRRAIKWSIDWLNRSKHGCAYVSIRSNATTYKHTTSNNSKVQTKIVSSFRFYAKHDVPPWVVGISWLKLKVISQNHSAYIDNCLIG